MAYRTLFDFPVYVNAVAWELAVNGDDDAKARIADALDGVDVYFHIVDCAGIPVTVADLLCHGIIKRVTLHKDD